LALLEKNHQTIVTHNDALAREVLLLTQLGHYDKAIQFMKTHHFRRWEGLGNIHTSYVNAYLLRGQGHVKAERYEEALEDLGEALKYPDNLEVARSHHGGRDCQVYYFMATAYETSGNEGKAREFYEKSAAAKQRDGWTELRYYQGMALKKLGQKKKANENFAGLIDFAKEQFKTTGKLEFFAKFGTRLSEDERLANLHYLTGLGYLGKGKSRKARAEFEKALKLNVNHLWARILNIED
jgi:tetratricopeptide (TPR) repeat protein